MTGGRRDGWMVVDGWKDDGWEEGQVEGWEEGRVEGDSIRRRGKETFFSFACICRKRPHSFIVQSVTYTCLLGKWSTAIKETPSAFKELLVPWRRGLSGSSTDEDIR